MIATTIVTMMRTLVAALAGTTAAAMRGSAAPSANDAIDERAACHGRAIVASVMPSSSMRWMRNASFSVRRVATSRASSWSSPFSW